jgi:hypothetical protein
MLKKTLLAAVLATFLLPAAAGEGTYGQALTLDTTTAIGDILDDPHEYEGALVRVEGSVSAMCVHKGCWLRLEAPDGRLLLTKSTGDKVQVPGEALGRKVTVEGVVVVEHAEDEGKKPHKHHHGEGKGEGKGEGEGHECATAKIRLETRGVVVH